MTYVIKTSVERIERRSRVIRSKKVNDQVFAETEDLGWFVQFAGSHEMLHMGFEKPEFRDENNITIRID